MDKEISTLLKPDSSYSIVADGFNKVQLALTTHSFSQRFMTQAQEAWVARPGKYDGDLMGVKRWKIQDGILAIDVFHMKYSWHRYIANTLATHQLLPSNERIYPLCVNGLAYIEDCGKKYYVTGLKKSGNIDAGKLEIVPAGFCDFDAKDLENYLHRMLAKELREEMACDDLHFTHYIPLALVTDNDNAQYSILIAFKVIEANRVLAQAGKETEEHEKLVLIPEEDLELLVQDPTGYLHQKIGYPLTRKIDFASTTRALLYYTLKNS